MSLKSKHISRWSRIIVTDDNDKPISLYNLKSDGSLSIKFAKQAPRNIASFYNKVMKDKEISSKVQLTSVSSLLNPLSETPATFKNHYFNKIPPISSIFEKMGAVNENCEKFDQENTVQVASLMNVAIDEYDILQFNV